MNFVVHVSIVKVGSVYGSHFLIMEHVNYADAPFFLNFEQQIDHLGIVFLHTVGTGIEYHRAVEGVFYIGDNSLNCTGNGCVIKRGRVFTLCNFAKRLAGSSVISGKLVDDEIRRSVLLDPFETGYIGALVSV